MTTVRRNILFLFLLSAICSAADRMGTDREVLAQLSDSLMGMVSGDLSGPSSLTVKVGDDSVSTFFRPTFILDLSERGHQLFLKSDSTTTTLELNVQESSVFYGEIFTGSLFGPRLTERSVTLSVIGTISSNGDGKILRSRTYSLTAKDTVQYSMIDQLTSSSLPYTRITRPELSFFDAFLEPAIVTISSGIVIYLFFTIRS